MHKKSPREDAIGAKMAILVNLTKRLHNDTILKANIKITIEQIAILETLIFYGEMNMSQLSTKTWKQNANITRIVDKLEKQKLLIRKAQPEDRRTNLISVTKEGKHIFKQTMPIIIETNKKILSNISKEEIEITKKVLNNMIKNII